MALDSCVLKTCNAFNHKYVGYIFPFKHIIASERGNVVLDNTESMIANKATRQITLYVDLGSSVIPIHVSQSQLDSFVQEISHQDRISFWNQSAPGSFIIKRNMTFCDLLFESLNHVSENRLDENIIAFSENEWNDILIYLNELLCFVPVQIVLPLNGSNEIISMLNKY